MEEPQTFLAILLRLDTEIFPSPALNSVLSCERGSHAKKLGLNDDCINKLPNLSQAVICFTIGNLNISSPLLPCVPLLIPFKCQEHLSHKTQDQLLIISRNLLVNLISHLPHKLALLPETFFKQLAVECRAVMLCLMRRVIIAMAE